MINTENLEIASQQVWERLSRKLDYLPSDDLDFVRLAFEVMVENHDQQRRKSGDFYIVHPASAAMILAELELDKITLAACLLHDVPEDTFENPQDGIRMIQKEFGPEVAFLVSGITKLSNIKYQGKDRYVENLRKMFVAMSQDLRVVFIKLADRLHNLRTLKGIVEDAGRPDKAQRIAMESLEIYAPIAERLGMGKFRGWIEDAAFPFAYPEEYKKFTSLSAVEVRKRSKQVERLINKTKRSLVEAEIKEFEIKGRAKKYYSIYRKLTLGDKQLSEIYDLVALRIIVSSVADCYHVLSILHARFDYIPERVKDYIKEPKENGYQSIHTTVMDMDTGLKFEFQIRTYEMQEYAEFGVASHWSYKQGLDSSELVDVKRMQWINELVELGKKGLTNEEYLEQVNLNLFIDRIFVFTPKNDVINLPKGATPLDFAFKIHGFIGSHASLAKVNGKVVKLNEKLQSGDVVEIVTDKNQKPKPEWLNWVESSSTSRNLRQIMRKQGFQFPDTAKKINQK